MQLQRQCARLHRGTVQYSPTVFLHSLYNSGCSTIFPFTLPTVYWLSLFSIFAISTRPRLILDFTVPIGTLTISTISS